VLDCVLLYLIVYAQRDGTHTNLYYLGFYFKNSKFLGLYHAHHQEYITAKAAVGIIYECGIVK
jgi:hypothetical protein